MNENSFSDLKEIAIFWLKKILFIPYIPYIFASVQNLVERLNSIQFFPQTEWSKSIQVQFIVQKLNLNFGSNNNPTLFLLSSKSIQREWMPSSTELSISFIMTHTKYAFQSKCSMDSRAAIQVKFLPNELN